ncbi:MAG TPA: hypothetical protein ENJ09_12820 [Planctomycetes bacterium]|nr:hypothetical protein [Planctomycetota bacterium]
MKRLVSTPLGIVLISSIGAAGPGDGTWLDLDSEISDLAASLSPTQGGGNFAVLTRSALGYSEDDVATGGGPNVFGFDLNDIDVAFWGGSGGFTYRVGFDLDSGSASLEDAYAQWACGESASVRIGNFKPHVLRSGWIDPEGQLFIDRTVLGSTYDLWDAGAQVFGQTDNLGWSVSAQNGTTGVHSSHLWVLGVWWDIGAGAGIWEGARGGNGELNATLGISITNESGRTAGPSDNTSALLEFNGNYGKFGFGIELADIDKDDGGSVSSDFGIHDVNLEHPIMGDSNPYSVTLSYLVTPDVEVGVRREVWDDSDGDDTNAWTLGANYYRSGNNAKWQAQFTSTDDSSHGDDGAYWQVGLTVGASR